MWKLVLIQLEIVVILTQDRCTVCAEGTIGLEIILDAVSAGPTGYPARKGEDLV